MAEPTRAAPPLVARPASGLGPWLTAPPPADPPVTAPVADDELRLHVLEPAPQLAGLAPGAALRLGAVDQREPPPPAGPAEPHVDLAAAAFAALDRALPGERATAPPVAAPLDVALDRFAPPDSRAAPVALELAPEDVAHRARKRATADLMPALAPAPRGSPSSPPLRPSSPSIARHAPPPVVAAAGALDRAAGASPPLTIASGSTPALAASPSDPVATAAHDRAPGASPPPGRWWLRPLRSPRRRLAIGVALALGLGGGPAYLIASVREASAGRALDARLALGEAQPDIADSAGALEALRSNVDAARQRKRHSIWVDSLALWAATSAALGYVWVKRVPWHRLG